MSYNQGRPCGGGYCRMQLYSLSDVAPDYTLDNGYVSSPSEDLSDLTLFARSGPASLEDVLGSGIGRFESSSDPAHQPHLAKSDNGSKLASAYEQFLRSDAGTQMAQNLGAPAWDGYLVADMPGNALAATMTYSDGTRMLAWNRQYSDRLDAALLPRAELESRVVNAIQLYGHPLGDELVARAASAYEALYHESVHHSHYPNIFNRSVKDEEVATYGETARFYRGLADRSKDSNYAMSKFYDAIADASEKKAELYASSRDGDESSSSLDSLIGGSDFADCSD